jgi:hypothetical protein
LSTGDFKESLAALPGEETSGLSPTAISRLTAAWQADTEAFQKRDLCDRNYVYVWADGVHFRIRLEEDRLRALVMEWVCTLSDLDVGQRLEASLPEWFAPSDALRAVPPPNKVLQLRRKVDDTTPGRFSLDKR